MAFVEIKEDEDKLRTVLGIVQKYGMDAETLCDVVIELDGRVECLAGLVAKAADRIAELKDRATENAE